VSVIGSRRDAVLRVTKSRITSAETWGCDGWHSQTTAAARVCRRETPTKSPKGVVPYSADREGAAVMPHAAVPSYWRLGAPRQAAKPPTRAQPVDRSAMLKLKKYMPRASPAIDDHPDTALPARSVKAPQMIAVP